ncbi:MAG: arabinosyltransferase domain-containing protein, partial [Nocardia sp.]|nr:arabinosyltransferase domain-containing protein [Nocardia sp.]
MSRIRLIALLSGLIAIVLAVATPLLPVRADRASLNWPQPQSLSVTAPLVSYVPLNLDASVPCSAFRDMPAGTVLSTVPAEAPNASAKGLLVKVVDDPGGRALSILQRDIPLLSAPLSEVGGCSRLVISSNDRATTVELTGVKRHDGTPFSNTVGGDVRGQVVGVFTDLQRAQLGDAHLHADIDSRFSSSPAALKRIAIVGAVLFTIASLICLHLIDTADGRRPRRFLPAHWWRISVADVVILGTLVVWHFIGANTSDDGYILNMARASRHSGFMSNYYRWFGVAEAPFGWPYEVLAWMTRVSDASWWMRLPALAAGVL